MEKQSDNKSNVSESGVRKMLGEPAAIEPSGFVSKVRANLLIASSICLVVVLAGVRIDTESSSFLGVKLIGLDQSLMEILLIIWIIYLLVHFLWVSFDQLSHWRLRISGNRVLYQTGPTLGSKDNDYPEDPSQSTLYSWWAENSKHLESFESLVDEIRAIKGDIDDHIELASPQVGNIDNNLSRSMMDLDKKVKDFKSLVERSHEIRSSQRIEASLYRFDRSFKMFLTSQNIRWIILEVTFPVVYSLSAIFLLMIMGR